MRGTAQRRARVRHRCPGRASFALALALLGFSVAGLPTRAADPDPELAALQQAVANDPQDIEARRSLGFGLQARGRAEEAIEHFEAITRKAPSSRGTFELAMAYSAAARLDEAERLYLELLKQSPQHPRVLHNLGAIATRRDDFEQAVEYYRRAIEVAPDYMLAYYHLAGVLERMGATEQAYAAYLTILEMPPQNASEQRTYVDAAQRAAATALALGDPAQAESLLSQLLQAHPDHAEARYTRAQALMQLGREDEARRELEAHARLLADRKPTSAAASGD